MANELTLKQGDTAPKAVGDLNADLTGATVSMRLTKLNGTFVMTRAATITDATAGIVEYQWVAANDSALLLLVTTVSSGW